MILTGDEIYKNVKKGEIVISPFNCKQLNPNSYNYRIGESLLIPTFNDGIVESFQEVDIPQEGYMLKPNQMYLANTYETLGSEIFSMSLIGRSSIGRLGLFLQVSANLGHTGSIHKWTLELVAAKNIIIYPKMIVGQISFWVNSGVASLYNGYYTTFDKPKTSKLFKE